MEGEFKGMEVQHTDPIGRLIATAGPRPTPPPDIVEMVRQQVQEQLFQANARRQRHRWGLQALAATVTACVAGLGWFYMHHTNAASVTVVASLVDSRGAVRAWPLASDGLLQAGMGLRVGTHIETGKDGLMALNQGSEGVRIGPSTSAVIETGGQIRLVQGAVYVDHNPALGADDSLAITSAYGTVTHVGTQFQVVVHEGEGLWTAVREGNVTVQMAGKSSQLVAGRGLQVDAAGKSTESDVSTQDPRWQWVSDLVPDFSIEGRSMSAFLDWYARESGRKISYASPSAHAHADTTRLNGSINGLSPTQALSAVLATTQFECDLSVAGQMLVKERVAGNVIVHRNEPSRHPTSY